jgi:hypothetical protein
LSAIVVTAVFLGCAALITGIFRGFITSLDMLLGAAIVLLPSVWVAMSLTSGRALISPVWMGFVRYTLAGLGFAALFALRPASEPLPVMAGSVIGVVGPPLILAWRQRQREKVL